MERHLAAQDSASHQLEDRTGAPITVVVCTRDRPEELRSWGEIRMVVFALLVLVAARAFPAGLMGLGLALGERLSRAVPALAPLLTARPPAD